MVDCELELLEPISKASTALQTTQYAAITSHILFKKSLLQTFERIARDSFDTTKRLLALRLRNYVILYLETKLTSYHSEQALVRLFYPINLLIV